MRQQEFELSRAGESQCDRILERLMATPGQWVPMPELYRISGAMAVHSRVADLRKRGVPVEHRNVRQGNRGAVHSFYRVPEN
jgi:hypothetical protein